MTAYRWHAETSGLVQAAPEAVFARLDDHTRLSAHMSRRSWRMGWGKLTVQLAEHAGRAVGSRIRLAGRVFGIRLALQEVVTERETPVRKVWETVGAPKLLVIGAYRMGFLLSAREHQTGLTVFIDYDLPGHGVSRWLGRLFGHWYAKWCTASMVQDARKASEPGSP